MTWKWRGTSMSLCATTKWLRNGIKLGHQGSDEMNGMYPPPSGRSHDRAQTPHLRSPIVPASPTQHHGWSNRLMDVLKGGQLSKWSSPLEILFFHLLLVSFFDFGQCCAQQRTKLGNFTKLEYYLGQLSKIRPISTAHRIRNVASWGTGSLSHLRAMLPESSSCPQPAQRPNHAT